MKTIQKKLNRVTFNDDIAFFSEKGTMFKIAYPRTLWPFYGQVCSSIYCKSSEILARILFSKITLKDISATIKIRDRDLDMIYLHQ